MKLFAIFIAGVLVAVALRWSGNERARVEGLAPQQTSAALPERKEARRWTAEDFSSLVRQLEEDGRPGLARLMDDRLSTWSDREIADALAEAVADRDCIFSNSRVRQLMDQLTRQWMKRDLPGFLKWLESLQPESLRSVIGPSVSRHWPPDRAEEALDYAAVHPEFFSRDGGAGTWQMTTRALEEAAKKGPAEMNARLRMIREQGLTFSGINLRLPAGFDFQTFVAGEECLALWKLGKADFVADQWIEQAPEKAFEAIRKVSQENGVDPTSYLFYRQEFKDQAAESQHMEWVAAHLNELDHETRQGVLEKGVAAVASSDHLISSLVSHLDDPQDRELAYSYAARSILSSGAEAALRYLEEFSPVDQRVAWLEQMEPLELHWERPRGTPEEQRAILRRKLEEWNATPTQIEGIMNHLGSKLR